MPYCVLERSYSDGSVRMVLAAGKVTSAMPCTTPAALTTVLSVCVATGPAALLVGYASRSRRWSPTRRELAIAVKAGFTAPMLGKTLVSTT